MRKLKLLSYPVCPAECSERIDAMTPDALLEAWSAATGISEHPTGDEDVSRRICRADAWSLCQVGIESGSSWKTYLLRPGESGRSRFGCTSDQRYLSLDSSLASSLMKTVVKLFTARQMTKERAEVPNAVLAYYDQTGCQPTNERFVFLPRVGASDLAWLRALVCRDLTLWDAATQTQIGGIGQPGYERWIVISHAEQPGRSDAFEWWTVPAGESMPGDAGGAPLFFAVFDDYSCIWVEAWNQPGWPDTPQVSA